MRDKAEIQVSLRKARAALLALVTEQSDLTAERNRLERRLGEISKRLEAICGGYGNHNELGDANHEIQRLQLLLDDCDRPVVVWSRVDSFMPKERSDWVVDKVTNKRIYVRARGSNGRTDLFGRDGESITSYRKWAIDLDKTGIPRE